MTISMKDLKLWMMPGSVIAITVVMLAQIALVTLVCIVCGVSSGR
ncbi:MAG: hypothetical protein AAGH65_01955 [Pseudomonadota bacterium]